MIYRFFLGKIGRKILLKNRKLDKFMAGCLMRSYKSKIDKIIKNIDIDTKD